MTLSLAHRSYTQAYGGYVDNSPKTVTPLEKELQNDV